MIHNRRLRKETLLKDRLNPYSIEEKEFFNTTRFTKEVFSEIVELCKPIERLSKKQSTILLPLMVYLSLRYYASGPFHRVT